MLQIKVPQSRLEEALLATRRQWHQRDVWVMGVSDSPVQGIKELLYHDRLGNTELTAISWVKPEFVPVLVQTTEELNSHVRYSFLRDVNDMPVGTGLLFITRRDNMQVFYTLKSSKDADDPVVLSVPGPNMERLLLLLLDGEESAGKHKQTILMPEESWEHGMDIGKRESRHECDRLAGAIGLGDIDRGFELLARARKLVVVIIGTGRAGSRLAFRLAQESVGAQGALVLVDPDMTAPSNLEGMIVPREAVGFPKVYGVGKIIAAITGGVSRPTCLYASLNDPEVQDVLRVADVVFTAVDEPAPRLATAVLAARYHVLHIDVTGGLAWTQQKRAVVGGELRVFIPGSQGCLGCFDQYNWREAVRLLGLSSEAERERRQHLDWHRQRPGSSADILMPVIGEALQAFWGILRGQIRKSFWLHYEKDYSGHPVWTDWSDRRRLRKLKKCNICEKQAGLGDITE